MLCGVSEICCIFVASFRPTLAKAGGEPEFRKKNKDFWIPAWRGNIHHFLDYLDDEGLDRRGRPSGRSRWVCASKATLASSKGCLFLRSRPGGTCMLQRLRPPVLPLRSTFGGKTEGEVEFQSTLLETLGFEPRDVQFNETPG